MLGMMGNKSRMAAMLSSQISNSHGPYGPSQLSDERRDNYGDSQFRMAAMDLINAVRNDDPERMAQAFKSLHRICHQTM